MLRGRQISHLTGETWHHHPHWSIDRPTIVRLTVPNTVVSTGAWQLPRSSIAPKEIRSPEQGESVSALAPEAGYCCFTVLDPRATETNLIASSIADI